jgi:hypothetical protein
MEREKALGERGRVLGAGRERGRSRVGGEVGKANQEDRNRFLERLESGQATRLATSLENVDMEFDSDGLCFHPLLRWSSLPAAPRCFGPSGISTPSSNNATLCNMASGSDVGESVHVRVNEVEAPKLVGKISKKVRIQRSV